MIDVTGSLQVKNKIYQAVLSFKQNNKWKTKWVSTKVPAVKGNKKQAQAKLEEIKKNFQEELNNTDYKIIKCSEYQLAGLEIPYNIAELHANRQRLRDKINELQEL